MISFITKKMNHDLQCLTSSCGGWRWSSVHGERPPVCRVPVMELELLSVISKFVGVCFVKLGVYYANF
jgi:hypothetical protein